MSAEDLPTIRSGWHCVRCGVRGVVVLAGDVGVYEAVTAIEDDHHEESPGCDGDRFTLRIPSVDVRA